MFVETPRKIILGGPLRACEITMLIDHCDRLHASGRHGVSLDMSAVTDCDRGGLSGLQLLTSGVMDLAVDIDGLCWAQFMVLLGSAPAEDVHDLCEAVRTVLGATSGSRVEPNRTLPVVDGCDGPGETVATRASDDVHTSFSQDPANGRAPDRQGLDLGAPRGSGQA